MKLKSNKIFVASLTLTLSITLSAKEKKDTNPFPATKEFQGLHCKIVSQNPMKDSPVANLLLISKLDRDGNPKPKGIKIYYTETLVNKKAKEIWNDKLFISTKSTAKQTQSDTSDLRYEIQTLDVRSQMPNESYSLSFDANINDNSGHSISGQGSFTKFVGLGLGFVNSSTSPMTVNCVDPVGIEK